jgi:RNA polymerase sigma-70 factor, ECF subfamily
MDQTAFARLPMPATPTWVRASDESAPASTDGREQSDEVLLRLAGEGSNEALSSLFRKNAHQIWNIGRRILRDPAEAEDLVQEVFLYLYRRSALYDPSKGSARSWLIQIAYSQAFLRRRKLKSLGMYEAPGEEICDSHPSEVAYDRTVEALFGRNCWKRILDNLTSDQEQVLRLHFFEGYTFAEIAEKLGQSYANVRNHHYRGLEKLRRHLAADALNRR